MTAFLDREMKSGSLVSLRRSFHGRLEFAFTTKDSRYPIITFESSDSSPSFRKAVRALTQSGSFQGISDEISGATQNEGGSYAYFFSPRETFLQYRLLAVFDDREIDRNARLRERLLRAGFVSVLVLALFMGSLLSRRMLGPVAILDQGMDRIRSGDLQTTLPDLGTDEISVLGLNVNHLVKELRERERMQAYISETVLEAIRHPPSARELDARSREVTILISDIRGFTALSERHSPEEMFGMLNEYFESVEPILRSFGGQVQKFIGDAVYAVFPGEGRVGALGAVQAAREMKLFLEKFNHRRQAGNTFPIEIGIGICTGPVLLGKLGNEARMDYTYIGLEVGRASRLESASKCGRHTRIILSSQTRDLVSDVVRTAELALPGAEAGEETAIGHEIINW